MGLARDTPLYAGFGVNIDEQEKEKIIQFVRKKLNPHINLYQMRVYADAFKLQPEIINL